MDLMMRYHDGPGMGSGAGVVEYFGGHLQETKEAGELGRCPGYLSRDGQVRPEVHNPDLWREVGWDLEKEELPPPELLQQLSRGYDLERRQLTQARGFRQPKEALITLPVEVSQSLRDHPETAREVLRATVSAHLREVEREAIRVRVGGGKREWREGRTLSLSYLHAENRGGEVHYHAHVMTFIPAKAQDGTWRSWDNGRNVMRLSKPGGGRAKATDAMLEAARRHGLEIELRRGVAAGAPGEAQGATVTGLDGRVIAAGSLDRKRRVEILAAQELKRELGGVVPLTPRELEIVRKESGKLAVQKLSGERRRKALAEKLNALGLLGEDGRILAKADLAERLKAYEAKLAQAQVQLEAEAQLPGARERQRAAADLIQAKREQVAAVAGSGVDLAASATAARIRWTKDYERVMGMVQAAGSLRTEHLDKRDRDLLSKLKKAGLLDAEKVRGLNEYRLTELGEARLKKARGTRDLVPPAPTPQPAPADEPFSLQMIRKIREYEASDPEDLRERVALREEEIREVFPEVALAVLQPVQEALELPDGRRYALAPVPATREAIHGAVGDLETVCLEVAEVKIGRSFERSPESQFVAETWFRAGYGLRPIGREELERPWAERLGRLVRQGWDRLVDQAVELADRARQILGLRAERARYEAERSRPRAIENWDAPPSQGQELPKSKPIGTAAYKRPPNPRRVSGGGGRFEL